MKISSVSGSLRSTSASSLASEDSFETPYFPEYEDLTFRKKLSEAKFPVYLVEDDKTNQKYAMKVFPYEDGAPSLFYLREVRFTNFVSPNIISVVHYEREQKHTTGSETTKFSYILMEYAPYGDFFDVLVTYRLSFNETLVRTYFYQLVEGVEALHSKGAAHLDLKLENLMMSKDFKLKLIDFDLGYIKGDGKVKTRGTKNFRAPELLSGKCTNPQAADVFSMGVILFILKTGCMVPFTEDESANCLSLEEFKKVKPKEFWEKQCDLLKKSASFFSEDFKSLFMWMTMSEPEERPTLVQIKKSRWYGREIYSEEEVVSCVEDKLQL